MGATSRYPPREGEGSTFSCRPEPATSSALPAARDWSSLAFPPAASPDLGVAARFLADLCWFCSGEVNACSAMVLPREVAHSASGFLTGITQTAIRQRSDHPGRGGALLHLGVHISGDLCTRLEGRRFANGAGALGGAIPRPCR